MSARQRRMKKQRHSKRVVLVMQVLAGMLAIMLLVAGSAAALGGLTIRSWLEDLPDPSAPGAFEVAQATRIYSADGKLLARLYLENREVVPISSMSTDLVDAVVAIEDERFFEHNGVDPAGIVRAALKNLAAGSTEEGASTITQQYVRNTILLDERTDISLARKIREAYLAMELEKRYEKRDILEMYLNAIYFGEGAYGAQAASRVYFAKPASQLTLAQCALLAGLPQQPGRLDPYEHAEAAVSRRNVVLYSMLTNNYITRAEYDSAVAEPLKLKRARDPEDGIYSAPYFVAHVKKLLQSQFSPGVVFKGGLSVHTTLDTRLQKYAESAMKRGLPSSGPDGALVSLDPRNGYVKAIVGGRDYHKNKFNLATQGKRQAGSSFKTFTLVTALNEGMPPSFRIDSSSPAYIPTKPRPWRVSNSEGSGHGAMTLERATQLSVNTVFARVAWAIGPKKIAKMANKMGIESELAAFPSITLGAQNVSPLEMAAGYATLANNGVRHKPVFITKVYDRNNKLILEAEPKGKRVISRNVAWAATRILMGVISQGTARRASIGRPAAGKTGTSQNHRDVWFVGYTPDLVTAVWVGHRKERTIVIRGSRAFGGTVCAPIWADFMRHALKGSKALRFKTAPSPKYNSSRFKIIRAKEATKTVGPKRRPSSGGGGGGGGIVEPPPDGGGGGGEEPPPPDGGGGGGETSTTIPGVSSP